MQVAVAHRCLQQLREPDGVGGPARHDHAATREDHRELRGREKRRSFVECGRVAGAAADAHRRLDRRLDVAVEIVARNVELARAHLEHCAVEAAARDLRHALRVVHVALVLGDLREDRELLRFLEAAEPHGHRAGLGRDEHHRRMRPVRRGDRRDEVGDARAVLRDAHAVAPRRARIAVRHVRGALLVRHRDEADAGGREDVERVHVGRAHDAEDLGHAVGRECLHQGFGRRHALRG